MNEENKPLDQAEPDSPGKLPQEENAENLRGNTTEDARQTFIEPVDADQNAIEEGEDLHAADEINFSTDSEVDQGNNENNHIESAQPVPVSEEQFLQADVPVVNDEVNEIEEHVEAVQDFSTSSREELVDLLE